MFVTFTFKKDISDVNVANGTFRKFIKRINYNASGGSKKGYFKYLSVIDFQDFCRGGVVHYHTVFFNMSSDNEQMLHKEWKNGVVNVRMVEEIENVGLYMSKGNAQDARLDGHKRYFRSQHLLLPTVIKDESKARSVIGLMRGNYTPKVRRFHGFQGNVTESVYELNKGENLLDMIPEIKYLL